MSKIFSIITRTGRAAAFCLGLAAKPASLKAGVQNAVKATTSMVGTLAGPILKLDNNGAGPALGLEVQDSAAPLMVNEGAGTAAGLSADELDGKNAEAFMPAKIYKVDRDVISTATATAGS
jgi:hypothetical protein